MKVVDMADADVENAKKRIQKLIENLGRSEVSVRESWAKTVEEHRETLDEIKKAYRQKQSELRRLVEKDQTKTISRSEFLERVRKIQDELAELESKILRLRLREEF